VKTLFDTIPYQSHSDTSREAADGIAPSANRLRAAVFEYLRSRGADGATDEEGIRDTGISPSTYRPRRIECQQVGRVIDSGRKRKTASGRNAVVWIAVEVK
jgi:hypothetical protein